MKNRVRILVALLAYAATVLAVPAAPAGEFIVPGADFGNLSLQTGAWCRYLVVDEALGEIDSTELYIGVPGWETTPQGRAVWIEIESRPLRGAPEEAQAYKLLVLEHITSSTPGDSLGEYVLELYNKTGTQPSQEEDPRRFKEFSLPIPTTDSTWVSTADIPSGTAAGDFRCIRKERIVNDDREIKTGHITLVKNSRDDYAVWFSERVPIFHLVRCVIKRSRHTETRPPVTGIPVAGRKDSMTTAELVAFGFDAGVRVPVERTHP